MASGATLSALPAAGDTTVTKPDDMDDVRFLRYIIQDRLQVTTFSRRDVMRVTNRFMAHPERLTTALDTMVKYAWLSEQPSPHYGKFASGKRYVVTRNMPVVVSGSDIAIAPSVAYNPRIDGSTRYLRVDSLSNESNDL
jgi:hypothetical protein